jgi:MFS transporter, putative metabolite transport protein
MGMLRRMTAATAIGEGLDGFDLGIIAVVLPLITKDLGLTPVWSGLIAASTLVGIFFGSPIVGWLSDRIGRRTLFTIDIAAFVVLGLLQAVVTEPWQLMVVRLLLGVAVGARHQRRSGARHARRPLRAARVAELAHTPRPGRRGPRDRRPLPRRR